MFEYPSCGGLVPLRSRPDRPCPRTDYVLEVTGGCVHEHLSRSGYCADHAPAIRAKLASRGHPMCRHCLYGSEPHECTFRVQHRATG